MIKSLHTSCTMDNEKVTPGRITSVTATLHKLTAGDGYTYLTRQVAALDGTERGYSSLGDYYSAKGESPGIWRGLGLEALGVSGRVSEKQMLNLFGQGIHPDAERVRDEAYARGATVPQAFAATRLGRAFPVYEGSKPWRTRLAKRFEALNQEQGLPGDWPIPAEERTRIRTEVGLEMFAETYGRAPLHSGELSGFVAQQSRPESSAIAGFDVTFSPVKSVSTLWAIAPREVSERIEAAHQAAVIKAVEFLESQAGYTRVGTHGVAQVETRGLITAQFTHRDSRAGDPDLHTHVAVSNKVQTLDGRWLALDARMLYRFTVAASEFYNTQLEAEVVRRVGGVFVEKDMGEGKRPVRELADVEPALNERWSRRRKDITTVTAELSAKFVADHGRVPTVVESLALAQQATLDTRDAKHEPRSLAEQRDAWRQQAVAVLGGHGQVDAMVRSAVRQRTPKRRVNKKLVARLTIDTLTVLEGSRSQWREHHVLAEATRQVRSAGIAPDLVNTVATRVTTRVLHSPRSVRLGILPDDPDGATGPGVPDGLRRTDGTSVFRVAKAQLYTSVSVIEAEQRILVAAAETNARRIGEGEVQLAMLEWSANTGGRTLNTAQEAMVREVATGGRRVHLALAPAGTGKTTVMGVLARAWQGSGGTVLGLAPQASAAEELRDALTGVVTDTVDKLVWELTNRDPAQWPAWITGIDQTSLVIVDEAGLASTRNLDAVITHVRERGGRVLLVGDDRQRAATGAGGVLRDIDAAHGCSTLVEVMRFADPVEGQASLAMRGGDASAVGFYADHDRLHAVTGDTAIDAVYTAWAADRAAGHESIMMVPTLEQVAQLNARARVDRLATTPGPVGPQLLMGSGDTVSAGDLVVAKRNNRWIRLGGGTDFVQNNHRFVVDAVNPDGSLTVTHLGRNVRTTLPADYVRCGHVRLGYAHTLAGCQGMTIGTPPGRHGSGVKGTAHALLTPGMSRNEVYPGMTRAVTANHAWIDTGSGSAGGDPHQVIKPESVTPPTISELFAQMIGRDGGNRSVTTDTREAQDPVRRLGPAADAYAHGIVAGAENLIGSEEVEKITQAAEKAVPGVTAAPAWETLRGHLIVLAAGGQDPVARLAAAAAERELDTARDPAAVLDWRLDETGNHSLDEGPLPWLPAIPAVLAAREQWAPYLRARADLVTHLADQVTAQARAWNPQTAPVWAQPYLTKRQLLVDLAVWRAAQSVDPDDLRPAGPHPGRIALRRLHEKLVERCLRVTGDPGDGTHRWGSALTQAGITVTVTRDDYWPVLASRLTLADTAGLPVPALLAGASEQGPLPAEQPAAALWWRLAPHLAGLITITPGGHTQRVRPPWTTTLEQAVDGPVAERITGDPLWPTLVARVDTAAAHGADPDRLITDAAGLLTATQATLRPDQYATVLLFHIGTLADSAPVTPGQGVDNAVPPDPADADLQPPDDLHTLHPRTTVDHPPVAVNADVVPDLSEPPADAELVPPDPDVAPFGPLPEPTPDPTALGRAAAATAAAWDYFRDQAPRSWVPSYLAGRRLDALDAGYAPSGDRLLRHLHQLGYTDVELLAAGLARSSNRDGKLTSRFHNRLMLPIHDTTGRVVAFIGRKHPDQVGDAPKYLNTPTTDLFRKHDLPYGLGPEALDRYRAGADLVIVEGPTDAHAIVAANASVGRPAPVVIAPMGTALTAGHLATLDDIAPLSDRQVALVLDNDAAGRAAAHRAHDLLLTAGVTDARTITLPDGQDPAQLFLDSPDALVEALQHPSPLVDFVIDDVVTGWMARVTTDGWGCVEAVNALREVAPIIARLSQPERVRLAILVADSTGNDLITVIEHIQSYLPEDSRLESSPLGLPTPPRIRVDLGDRPTVDTGFATGSLNERIRAIGDDVANVSAADGPSRARRVSEESDPRAVQRPPSLGL